MNNIESMKQKEIDRINYNNEKAVKYGEGYADGYSDGYDKAIEHVKSRLVEKYTFGGGSTKEQKTDSELRPAIYFMHKNTRGQQLRDIGEELYEVSQAWNDGEKPERIAEELADVQMSCETMMAMLGFSMNERKEIRKQVIEKNTKRGYYKEEV